MIRLLTHPEARVVAVLLASVLAGEAVLRSVAGRLSQDVQHLTRFEAIADELTAPADEPEPLRVLFLGNSLTRCGVDLDAFDPEAESAAGRPVVVRKLNPDNTAVADWFYAYRNYFAEQSRAPDLLVIGFQAEHLVDAPSNHPRRLAQFYCDAGDWADLCRDDLRDFEARAEFLLAAQSSLVANRDRIERRVLDLVIPGYQDGLQTLNSRVQARRTAPNRQRTYDRLARLLEMARAEGTQVVLAAMPVLTPYEIDPALYGVAAAHGATLLDCRNIEGITPDMFPDGLHMNAVAAACYSRHLAHVLQPALARVGREPAAADRLTTQASAAPVRVWRSFSGSSSIHAAAVASGSE